MMKYIIILLTLGITPFLLSQERPSGNKEVSDEVKRPERKAFPKHWGPPPRLQTRDIRPLPGGFGMGSGTLAAWIEKNLKVDKEKDRKPPPKVKPRPKPQPILPRLEIPEETQKAIKLYKELQGVLKKDFESRVKALGHKATKEEMRQLTNNFHKENVDKIQDVKDLGRNINEEMKKLRVARPKRPEPAPEVKAKLAQVRLVKNSLDVARKSLHEELKGKSKEDREALINAFKESQKEKHADLKAAHKALAKEVRDRVQTKDRRE